MAFMLMPSEVARLVYGYIDDLDGCKEVAMLFLETCPHLREFAEGYRQGARYSAKINNMCLLDYLSNRPLEGSCGNSSLTDHQVNSSPQLNEDLLISTIKNTITKAFDEISGKQTERHAHSFQQIKEERMELKSQLLDSIQHDLFAKIRDTMKSVECSIIETLEERRNQRYSLADLQMPKTPRAGHFVPAAHSSLVNSPRRKSATPRRYSQYTPHNYLRRTPCLKGNINSPATSTQSASPYTNPPSQYSAITSGTSSPGITTDSSELDIQQFIDKPMVVNKFIQMSSSESMANKIAEVINKNMNCLDGGQGVHDIVSSLLGTTSNTQQQLGETVQIAAAADAQVNPPEQPLFDFQFNSHQMEEFLNNATKALNDDSEYNGLVDDIIQSTPFKMYEAITPSSAATSHGSLNTPNIFAEIEGHQMANKENAEMHSAVKNLLKDLKTPVKSINTVNESQSTLLTAKEVFGESTNSSIISNETVIEVMNLKSPTRIQNNSMLSPSNDSTVTLTNDASLNQSQASLKEPETGEKSIGSNALNVEQAEPKRSSVSKPVFHNQHLNMPRRSFSRLKTEQSLTRRSINYKGPISVTFNQNEQSIATQPSPALTTTIEPVVEVTSVSSPPSTPVQATPVHAFPSDMIQISNNQVVNSQTAPVSQTNSQFYFTNDGATLYDASMVQQVLVPSADGIGYTILSIAPQITSTTQNIYLPLVTNGSDANQTQPASTPRNILPAPATSSSPSMPLLSAVANSPNLVSQTDDRITSSVNASKRKNTSKPTILSKPDPGKKMISQKAPQQTVSGLSSEGSPLRSRREPRKSDLGKRITHSDEVVPLQRPRNSLKRKNIDTSFERERKITRQSEVINESTKVKTLLNSNLDSFLESVHNPAKQTETASNVSKEKPSVKQKQSGTSSSTAQKTIRKEASKRTGKGNK